MQHEFDGRYNLFYVVYLGSDLQKARVQLYFIDHISCDLLIILTYILNLYFDGCSNYFRSDLDFLLFHLDYKIIKYCDM